MPFPTHLILRAAACLSALFLVAGCSSSDSRAQAALTAYQAAAAANDLAGARKALLQLVQAKDDVADYWVELGKLQASTGDVNDAYYAFTRAYELDRGNAGILRAITELALRSGDITRAQSHAQELEIVSPGDPWVKLTTGWSAYSQAHFDESLAAADSMLASAPFDSAATALKARSLISLKRDDEAEDLLVKQIQAQPSDAGSLMLLAKIYVQRNDWAKAEAIAKRLFQLVPGDRESAMLLIEAAFRTGDAALGRQTSLRLLRPDAPSELITPVLDLWQDLWPSAQRVQDARSLASAARGLEQRLIFAAFLSRVGSPQDAARLAQGSAGLPVNAANAEANAVLADALSRMGNIAAAKSRFDAVIGFDPGNATALRGRSELELRIGKAAAAIVDAQKLVTVLPNSPADRLLLARAYSAAGNAAWANRTLWAAFKDIPADEKIFAALQATRKGNEQATRELQDEFDRQRSAKLNRGLL